MSELQEAISEMRNMRESYNQLARGVVTAPIVSELEDGKAAIIAAINAMGGAATASMSMGELADAIRALILVQLGELEFDRPIASAQEAANMLQDHCTKYVDDFTTIMDVPLIVDEWQAVEEVRYKRLLDYNFTQFSSDERKSGVYALTNCHNLRRLVFDALRTISLTDNSSQFVYGNMVRLEEVSAPELVSISSVNTGVSNNCNIFAGLSQLVTLSLPALTSIICDCINGNSNNNCLIFSDLSNLTTLSLPTLSSISSTTASYNYCQIFSNLTSLTYLYLPSLTSINIKQVNSGFGINCQIFSHLTSLTTLSLPAITTITIARNGPENSQIFSGSPNLVDIEIGNTDDFGVGSIIGDMRLNGINPTNVYGDAEKLAALNESIRTKWFANLYDYSGGTARTLTLASQLVAHLEAETIQVATDKNWTIATV